MAARVCVCVCFQCFFRLDKYIHGCTLAWVCTRMTLWCWCYVCVRALFIHPIQNSLQSYLWPLPFFHIFSPSLHVVGLSHFALHCLYNCIVIAYVKSAWQRLQFLSTMLFAIRNHSKYVSSSSGHIWNGYEVDVCKRACMSKKGNQHTRPL